MATLTVFPRGRIAPNVPQIINAIDIAGITEAMATLDPNVADYEDPTLLISIWVEVSMDSGTTWAGSPTPIVGGSHTKNGGFPFVTLPLNRVNNVPAPYPAGALARVTYTQNKNIRMGVILVYS